jgi:hypothetical protein
MIDDLSAQTPASCINRSDIIRMAREAGFADGVVDIVGFEGFERFAALVVAHTVSELEYLPGRQPVQVPVAEFVEMVLEKEHLVGKPLVWAQWPNEEQK